MAPDAKAESKSNNLSFWWGITPNLEMRLKWQKKKKKMQIWSLVCLRVGQCAYG